MNDDFKALLLTHVTYIRETVDVVKDAQAVEAAKNIDREVRLRAVEQQGLKATRWGALGGVIGGFFSGLITGKFGG